MGGKFKPVTDQAQGQTCTNVYELCANAQLMVCLKNALVKDCSNWSKGGETHIKIIGFGTKT